MGSSRGPVARAYTLGRIVVSSSPGGVKLFVHLQRMLQRHKKYAVQGLELPIFLNIYLLR